MILSRYEKWTGDGVKKLVTIPYVSMHDSTRVMVERLAVKLSEQGISIICRDLGQSARTAFQSKPAISSRTWSMPPP